jgi:hypothetical protein
MCASFASAEPNPNETRMLGYCHLEMAHLEYLVGWPSAKERRLAPVIVPNSLAQDELPRLNSVTPAKSPPWSRSCMRASLQIVALYELQ